MSTLAEKIFVSLLATSQQPVGDSAIDAIAYADIFYEAERAHTQKKHEEAKEEIDKARREQVIEILNHGTAYGQMVGVETIVSLLMRNGMSRTGATELLNDMANRGIICIGPDYVYLPVKL